MSKYGVSYHSEEGTYDVLENKGLQGLELVASFDTEEEAEIYLERLTKRLDEHAIAESRNQPLLGGQIIFKHTPGPWIISNPGDSRLGGYVRNANAEVGESAICEVMKRNREANAQLITTAPLLAAGVSKILFVLENNPEGTCDELIKDLCRDLLAKVVGK